jgi:acyl carrier protein
MIDEKVIEIINTSLASEFELDIDKMVPEALLFEDLGLDSLDRVDTVILLEQAFKFKIREEEEIRQIRTLGDIHTFVIKKIQSLRETEGAIQ